MGRPATSGLRFMMSAPATTTQSLRDLLLEIKVWWSTTCVVTCVVKTFEPVPSAESFTHL